MRADLAANADGRFYVAELDGEIVDSGLVSLSDLGDRFSLKCAYSRTLPPRRGNRAAAELVTHATGNRISSHVEEEASQPFAERSDSARRIARSSR